MQRVSREKRMVGAFPHVYLKGTSERSIRQSGCNAPTRVEPRSNRPLLCAGDFFVMLSTRIIYQMEGTNE